MYVYSLDEEEYHDYDDIQDMIDESIEEYPATIYKAQKKEYSHNDFICLYDLIDNMKDKANDIAGEWAESYLNDLNKDKKIELEKLIINWLDNNISKPSFFTVEKQITLTYEEFKKEIGEN